jgi:hypothetical protein
VGGEERSDGSRHPDHFDRYFPGILATSRVSPIVNVRQRCSTWLQSVPV